MQRRATPHPTESASRTLERFVERARALGRSELLTEKALNTGLQLEPDDKGTFRISFKSPRETLLKAHLMDLRLFVLPNEPVSFRRVRTIARARISAPGVVSQLDRLGSAWNAAERSGSAFLLVEEAGPVGLGSCRYRQSDVMNRMMNGRYFHLDPDRERELDELADVPAVRWLLLVAVRDYTTIVLATAGVLEQALQKGLVRD